MNLKNTGLLLFVKKVLRIVRKIPRGDTLSYQEVARKAGNERLSRLVGRILSQNRDLAIPCHRVICSDGSLGGYNRGIMKKRAILKRERAI